MSLSLRALRSIQSRDLRVAARHHALFLAVLAAGIGLRVMAQAAYWPALFFEDSYQYLNNTDAFNPGHPRPIGYPLLLWLLLKLPDLAAVPIAQHLLGLGMGVLTYALLLRWRVRRWVAALASVPVLLSGYQVHIEHMVMSDSAFQALVLGSLALLAWSRPTPRRAAIVGGLLGLSVIVRLVGQPLVLPAVIFLLIMARGWRRSLAGALALTIAFATPLVGYMAFFNATFGEWKLSNTGALARYARVAHFVRCDELPSLPRHERPLCPGPMSERFPPVGFYVWDPQSPAVQYTPPPGMTKEAVLNDFFLRVVANQPGDFFRAVASDFSRYFYPLKRTIPPEAPVESWQFPLEPRSWGNARDPDVPALKYGSTGASINEPLAQLLRSYQLGAGFVPGPVLGLAALAGLLAMFGVGRARRSGMRTVCFLFTSTGVGLLLGSSIFQFSWRYEFPALVLLPVAGALGLAAIFQGSRPESDRRVGSTRATGGGEMSELITTRGTG